MTNTEKRFRKSIKIIYPHAFIKKIPDYKVLGNSAAIGLPDYLVINNGKTIWYEVKKVKGNTISLRNFTDGQLHEFPKMIEAGAEIIIYVFTKSKGIQTFLFEELMNSGKLKF